MSAPKLTPEKASAILAAQEAFWRCGPTIPLTDTLAGLGYTLIPTDPASVEDMVDRGAKAMHEAHEEEDANWDDWPETGKQASIRYLTFSKEEYRVFARAVLTAAIPELKK